MARAQTAQETQKLLPLQPGNNTSNKASAASSFTPSISEHSRVLSKQPEVDVDSVPEPECQQDREYATVTPSARTSENSVS